MKTYPNGVKPKRSGPLISAGAWFVTPFFILFVAFGLFSLAFSFFVTFTTWDPFSGDGKFRWDGLGGYSAIFESLYPWNAEFWQIPFIKSIIRTVLNAVPVVLLQHLIAIPLAFVIHIVFRKGLSTLGVVFVLPLLAAGAAQASGLDIMTRLVMNPISDIFYFLGNLPIVGQYISFQLDWRSWNDIFIDVWTYTGWNILLYLMALSAVPRSLLEAAQIDGAGFWTQLRKIAVPIMRPMIFVAVCISVFRGMQANTTNVNCGQINFAAETLNISAPAFIHCEAFHYGNIANSNNMTWVFFGVLVAIIAAVYFWIGRNFTALETSASLDSDSSPLHLSKIGIVAAKIAVSIAVFVSFAPVVLTLLKGTQSPSLYGYEEPMFAIGDGLVYNWASLIDLVPNWTGNLWNSIYISGLASLGAVIVSALAGFAFAHLEFKFKNQLFMVVMAAMLFPAVSIAVPFLMEMRVLDWINTPRALWVPFMASAFGVFLVRQYVTNTIPKNLLEASRVDGASELRIFARIGLPNMVPVLATVWMFTFVTVWGQTYMAWLLMRDPETRIFPQVLALLASPYGGYGEGSALPFGAIWMGTAIGVLPLLVVYMLTAGQLGRGLGIAAASELTFAQRFKDFRLGIIPQLKKTFYVSRNPARKMDGSDAVRVYACLMVMLAHIWQRIDTSGYSQTLQEVQLFFGNGGKVSALFVLSGCLLSYRFWQSYLEGKPFPSLKEFARRRFLRIAPAYWAALTVAFIFARSYPTPQHEGSVWLRYFSGLTFTSSYHWLTFFPVEWDGPLWTISFEIFCYILMPVFMIGLFYFTRGRQASTALGLTANSFVKREATAPRSPGSPWVAFGYWILVLALIMVVNQWIVTHLIPDEEGRSWNYGQIGGAKHWMPNYNVIGLFAHYVVGVMGAGLIAFRRNRIALPTLNGFESSATFRKIFYGVFAVLGLALLIGAIVAPNLGFAIPNDGNLQNRLYLIPLVIGLGTLFLSFAPLREARHWAFDIGLTASVLAMVSWTWFTRRSPEFAFSVSDQPYYFPGYAVLIISILVLAPFATKIQLWIDNAFVRFSAKIAYGIYVWHYIVLEAIRTFHNPDYRYGGITSFWYWFGLASTTIVITYILAWLSHIHIETPFLPKSTSRRGSSE